MAMATVVETCRVTCAMSVALKSLAYSCNMLSVLLSMRFRHCSTRIILASETKDSHDELALEMDMLSIASGL